MAIETGTRLGSYEIVEPIGRGSMGEVYRAKDLKLGRQVALKALLPEFASDDDRLRRFEQEARAASALNHPNIVQIYDIGEDNGTHYIVMELIEGTNLRELLRRAPFANDKLLELAQQMAAGLAKAHDAGIVHRDLKPENMMVTLDGFLKILDFGLAKLLDVPFETHSEMATMVRQGTRHGMLIGTVEYMSPEQASGKSVDHRSDQFSLGLILYEMATGTLTFHRETAAQTLASIIESDPKPMVELNEACPSDLVRIVTRCLRKAHTERYEDTRDLQRDLKAVALHKRELAPLPPVPQIPEPDVPSFGGGFHGQVRRGTVSNVKREIRAAFGETEFLLRSSDGRTRSISERRLRRKLRRNRFSGDEMVRRGDEGEWVPIYKSDLFRQEVPYTGDPAVWVSKRKVKDFLQHACSFVMFGIAWYVFRGEVPAWMGFWGIGLAFHAIGTLPAALPLLRQKRELAAPPTPALPETPAPLPDLLLSASFLEEVERVKELLSRRGGEETQPLVAEVDAIVSRMHDLAMKQRDLSEQTSPEERDALRDTLEEAERNLVAADNTNDRRLYQRQTEVVRQRSEAIDKALGVLGRLKVRQDVAEQQIKQLRLDLSRGEASSASVPKLTSRLSDIRHEVDATERVDEAIARELSS